MLAKRPINRNLQTPQMTDDYDDIPDVRDGLKRKERIVLYCLAEAMKERGGRDVPTVMLYGRVCEYISITEQELQEILQRLGTLTNPQ